MNKYGFDIEPFSDNLSKCTDLLCSNLRKGSLGLLLGAGVSYDIGLPSWQTLVQEAMKEIFPDVNLNVNPSNSELKNLNERIKRALPLEKYHDLIKRKLYDDVTFDFNLAKKNLLIALSSLIVGKTRGNVNHIITYNFDSVFEWYLQTNGLRVHVSRKLELLAQTSDVEITHLHGYLPHNTSLGENSDFLVFSKEEFEDRQVQYNYWKVVTQDFHRKHFFLAVGLSPKSIVDDLCPYLRDLDKWYETENFLRDYPYGVAYMTPQSDKNQDLEEKATLLRHGIIPCTIEISKIPSAVFEIAQKALTKSMF